jgi:pimeloyl-ACP methyl ester carboxylesterase
MQITVGEMVYDARVGGPEDGRAVLLLHGFPQTGRCWDAVAARLAADGCHCIAPDQRGYSPGARPAAVEDYAMRPIVADTVGMLDALGLDRVDVVGHDWGANVGWLLATWHPDRVRTLTAVSVPHPLAYGWAFRHDPEQQHKASYIALFRLPGKRAEEVLLADDARRLRRVMDGADLDPKAIQEYVDQLSRPGALTAALNWYRAMSGRDADGLGPVTVPTTYVWSTGDVALARAGAERCGEHVAADYRFVELDGISHWIPEQAPDALVDAILQRVATVSA